MNKANKVLFYRHALKVYVSKCTLTVSSLRNKQPNNFPKNTILVLLSISSFHRKCPNTFEQCPPFSSYSCFNNL